MAELEKGRVVRVSIAGSDHEVEVMIVGEPKIHRNGQYRGQIIGQRPPGINEYFDFTPEQCVTTA